MAIRSGRGRAWRRGVTRALDGDEIAAFLAAIEQGETVAGAAAAAGIAVSTAYYRRRNCPDFARGWAEAKAREIAAWSAAGAAAEGKTIVRGHAGRRLMRKRKRPVEFDRDRKQAFLDHFAGSCNLAAAARAAGVGVSAVYRALANDSAFAEGFQAGLEIGYRLLEAEALGQQRAAQLRYAIDPKPDPAAEAQSFERTMQLLREYNRGAGAVGRRAPRTGDARSRWSFDEAMAALEKELDAFEASGPVIEAEEDEAPADDEARREEAPPPPVEWSPSPGNPGEDKALGEE
ncbi:MAG: hypothetical protein ACT4N8_04925 [Sphingosinicella sp.]|uniref:hypothetical protein n=1 Tax=Sphingosinicella sp. TaxID=1917971 RepID=UPI004037A8E5